MNFSAASHTVASAHLLPSNHHVSRPAQVARAPRASRSIRAAAAPSSASTETACQTSGRRSAITGLASGLAALLAAGSSEAGILDDRGYTDTRYSSKVNGNVCDPGSAGAACRAKALTNDDIGKELDYGSTATKLEYKAKPGTAALADDQNDQYSKDLLSTIATVRAYIALGPDDKLRPRVANTVSKDGKAWVGKYAPGGSSRKESARALYSALSSVIGWVSFNGAVPLKGSLATQVLANCDKAEAFLEKGR